MTLTFRKRRHAVKLPNYQILEIRPLGHNLEIENYLCSCGLWEQAQNKLQEVYYYVQDEHGRRKNFFAAGWLNELGHWQVSAPNYIGCLSRPALTIIPGNDEEAWLYENYFAYLRHTENVLVTATVIILNSPNLIQAGLAKSKSFNNTMTFFNNPLPET